MGAARVHSRMMTVDSGATITLLPAYVPSLYKCRVSTVKAPFHITYANGTVGNTNKVVNFDKAQALIDSNIESPLLAVNTLLQAGNDVIFSEHNSYIRNVVTGKLKPFIRNDDNRLWELSIDDFISVVTDHPTTGGVKADSEVRSTLLDINDWYINADFISVKRVSSDYDKRMLETLIRIHITMGHPSVDNMYKAIKYGIWLNTGIDAEDVRRLWQAYACVACIMAKSNAIPVSTPTDPRTTVTGHTISCDPAEVSILGPKGEKWIFLWVDRATGHWLVTLAKVKSEFPEHLVYVIKWYASYGHAVRVLRTDDEVVLQSAEVKQILLDYGGVKPESSVPYQHQQNFVERHYQTLIKLVSALMYGQNLLRAWMWTHAVHHIVGTRNDTPNILTGDKSPNMLVTGATLNFANKNCFKWGELVAVGIRKEARVWKFDTKRELGVYLGQPDGYVDGHLIYYPYDKSVLVRGDVVGLGIPEDQLVQFYLSRFSMTEKKLEYKDMLQLVDGLGLARAELPEREPENEGPTYRIPAKVRMPTRKRPQDNIPVRYVDVDNFGIDSADFITGRDLESGDENSGNPEFGDGASGKPESIYLPGYLSPSPDERLYGSFCEEYPLWLDVYASRTRGPLNPTVGQALKSPDAAEWRQSMKDEILKNMLGTGTLKPIDRPIPGAKCSTLTMQLKDKIVKKKSRSCYRGDLLEKGYTTTYSPTIGVLTYSVLRNIAVIDEMDESLVDTVAAFLHQVYPESAPPLCVKVDPVVAECAGVDPHQWYRVCKYIYGIPDAGRAYYIAYSTLLENEGYIKSKFDPCLFYKSEAKGPIWIWIHVDDTYVCASASSQARAFVKSVQTVFEVTVKDIVDNYIGIRYTRLADGSKKMDQLQLLEDTCRNYQITDCPSIKTPTAYPSSVPPNLDPFNVTIYLSLLGVLLWLLHTRPETGFAVSYAATKAASPTMADWQALIRILQYEHQTRDKGVILVKQDKGCPLTMYIYCDASFLLYADSKAQSGYAFSLNNCGFFYSKSQKQAVVTTSSTHSELRSCFVAVCDYIFIEHVCEEVGRPLSSPAVVYEDNWPMVQLLTRDCAVPKASKHFVMLVNWAREQVQNGCVRIEHLSTNLMTPDILTKSVFGQDFLYKAQQLRGVHPGEEELLPAPLKSARLSEKSD